MYPGDWTERLAQLFADREAIVDVDDQGQVRQRISYAELRQRVAATAAALVELGVKQGARVAIVSKNRVEHLELMFACARLGALFLPVNWRLAAPEIHYILSDSTPAVVVVEGGFEPLTAGWHNDDDDVVIVGHSVATPSGVRRSRVSFTDSPPRIIGHSVAEGRDAADAIMLVDLSPPHKRNRPEAG